MLDAQQRKVTFMLGCEFLCHVKNAKVCPTCIMELYDVFTQKNVIRGVRVRKNRQKSFEAELRIFDSLIKLCRVKVREKRIVLSFLAG